MNNIDLITLKKENIKDFAFERNELLKKSKAEWVFFRDTDEVISPELKKEAIDKVNNSSKSTKAYFVIRRNYFLGQYIGNDKILRLARKGSGKWIRAVHETWKVEGEKSNLKNPLIHNTSENLHDYISKINSYSSLHAKANSGEGKKANLFKIIFFPMGKFIETLIKSKNVPFSIMQSFHSFLAWSKLYFSSF